MKKILILCLMALLFPYIVTLAWTGGEKKKPEGQEVQTKETEEAAQTGGAVTGGLGKKLAVWIEQNGEKKETENSQDGETETAGRKILLDRGEIASYIDVEEYLPGVIAKQISPDYEPEALKAQAVIARTYIYRQMGEEQEIPESALDLDYIEEEQFGRYWKEDRAEEYYERLEQAVRETKGMVMMYEEDYILPLFHPISAGRTRDDSTNYPYLESVECGEDKEAENYRQTVITDKKTAVERINSIPDAVSVNPETFFQEIQLVSRDAAGYVQQIQVGSKIFTGEEIAYALSLPSAAFTLSGQDDNLTAVCLGTGHGYGLSQYTAQKKAMSGWIAEDILKYFYKNIVIKTE